MALDRFNTRLLTARRQAIFLGATEPRAARPERSRAVRVVLVGQGRLAVSTIVALRTGGHAKGGAGWSIAGPVPFGYLDNRSYTEDQEHPAGNTAIHNPG